MPAGKRTRPDRGAAASLYLDGGCHPRAKEPRGCAEALLLLKVKGAFAPHLVLAGAPRKHVRKHLQHERYAPIRDLVENVYNPGQNDLIRLYEHAMALLLPSRIEGWGLPAGGALWCG